MGKMRSLINRLGESAGLMMQIMSSRKEQEDEI